MAHQEHSCKFLQKKGGKNIPFLDEKISHLEGGRGGGTESLNKKNLPQVVYKSLEPPWITMIQPMARLAKGGGHKFGWEQKTRLLF